MKYLTDLKSVLKVPKPENFTENSIKSLKSSHLGQLQYNPKLEIPITLVC